MAATVVVNAGQDRFSKIISTLVNPSTSIVTGPIRKFIHQAYEPAESTRILGCC